VEKVLDTRLVEIIQLLDENLDDLIGEVNQGRIEGKEQIMNGIKSITASLANRN
jgi:predicted transcriptional regulator